MNTIKFDNKPIITERLCLCAVRDEDAEGVRFRYELVLTPDASAKNVDRSYSYTIFRLDGEAVEEEGVVKTGDGELMITFTLAGGEYVEFYDLPIGSYAITEDDGFAEDYTTTVNGSAGYTAATDVTAETNTAVTVAYVNTLKRRLWDLVITTSCISNAQSFIFTVEGTPDDPELGSVKLDVVLTGDDSRTVRDLPAGVYTVTEKDSWSWRENTVEGETVELRTQSETVPFDFGVIDHIYWLSGHSSKKKEGR